MSNDDGTYPATKMVKDEEDDWLRLDSVIDFDGDGEFRYGDKSEDIEHDNLRRAGFALTAVKAYAKRVGADPDSAFSDLLGDMQHLADALDRSFDGEVSRGTVHYDAELRGES